MVDWHRVDFELPVLGSMTDDELERHMVGRDGRWSAPIKAGMARLKADKLDLDENWASRPPRWSCPCCGREKAMLLKRNEAGVMIARLDVHHDHLTDLLKAMLTERFGPKWPGAIPEGTGHVESLATMLVARFEPSMVCTDCNAADGQVKGQVRSIPRDFSFRPSEIARFVSVGREGEHRVDIELASRIFLEVKGDFEGRVALVEMLFERIAVGALTREPGNQASGQDANPLKMYRYLHSAFIRADFTRYEQISGDIAAFTARSVAREGVASRAKKKHVRAIEPPTAQDVAEHDGGGAPGLWRAVSDDWRCPGCNRSRAQILRPSKKTGRRFSGKLLRHTEYILDEVYEDGEEAPAPSIDCHEYHLICSDCAAVMTGIKQRNPDISISRAHFQLVDFTADAVVADNRAHDVDWERAAARARASIALADAIASYDRHWGCASGVRMRYRRHLERNGGDSHLAWQRLVAFYREEWPAMDDIEDHLSFLLEEAERIDIDDLFEGLSST